jgi:hypothetical protein
MEISIAQAILTSGLTVFGIASGAFLERVFVMPIADLRKCIGEVRFVITYWSNDWNNVAARKELREMACDLLEKQQVIGLFKVWAFFRIIPSQKSIKDITGSLIGMSNVDKEDDFYRKKDVITEILSK